MSTDQHETVWLKYAHLADYAAPGHLGKLTLVGIFDRIYGQRHQGAIPFPQFFLVAVFEASLVEGSDHRIAVKIVTADEHPTGFEVGGTLRFATTGEGQPLSAVLLLGFGPGVVSVPELGDYSFVFEIDGRRLGGLSFAAISAPGK